MGENNFKGIRSYMEGNRYYAIIEILNGKTYVELHEILEKQQDPTKLQNLINALCEVSNRCTVCFGPMANGQDCAKCKEYYCDCTCKVLTPDEIINGVDE